MAFSSVLRFLLWLLLFPVRGPFRLFRWWLRFLWRPVRFQWVLIPWRIILVTLALIGLPSVLVGLVEGVFFGNYLDALYAGSLKHFVENLERSAWMDSVSVPGAPGIHETAFAPYHIVQIREPMAWWKRLGLKRFDLPDAITRDNDVPFDQFARLDVLYRKVPWSTEPKKPWHHWIFASGNSVHLTGVFFDEWDKAFDELLQYHYANPAAHNATFQYIGCPSSFLCDIWKVRGPTLMHFTTDVPPPSEEEEGGDNALERPVVPGYDPVYVRAIEFPRMESWERPLHLPRDVFPSYLNQLRSVTSAPDVWMTEPIHTEIRQLAYRQFELNDAKREEYRKQTYGRLRDLEDWVWDRIIWVYPDASDSVMGRYITGTRMASLLVSFGIRFFFVRGAQILSEMFWSFFGVSEGDELRRMKREAEAQCERQPGTTGDFYEDVFGGIWGEILGKMMANMSDSEVELAAQLLDEDRAGTKGMGYGDDDDEYLMTPAPMVW